MKINITCINDNFSYSDYNLLMSGHECISPNEYLGSVQSDRECAQLCKETPECKHFIFEAGSNHSNCYLEKTSNSSCPEGWKENKDMNTYALKG